MADAAAITAAQMAYDNEKKEAGPMWLLWWFTGVFGGHRFYLGDTGLALGMLFTFGGLGVWSFIDVFFINGRRRQLNSEKQVEIFQRYGITPVPGVTFQS